MENVKEILIEFKDYFNRLKEDFISENNIDAFIMQSKYRPREPEAINRNEQTKEVCEPKGKSLKGWPYYGSSR